MAWIANIKMLLWKIIEYLYQTQPWDPYLQRFESGGIVLYDGVHWIANTEAMTPVVIRNSSVVLLDGEGELD